MSTSSTIEWTDATWNPTRGCRKISAGCKNCYAEKFAERFKGVAGHPYELGFMPRYVPDKLLEPLKWKKPKRIFVNSMSDLFLEDFDDAHIDEVLAVMLLGYQHTYQVLTKRAERMARYLGDPRLYERVLASANQIRAARPELTRVGISNPLTSPACWIWWGVSVENQEQADERIPHLLRTPAAVRFLSCEPLLSHVRLDMVHVSPNFSFDALRIDIGPGAAGGPMRHVDWVICGGESGPGARRTDVSNIRSIVRQCKKASVPVFVKQVGAVVIDRNDAGFEAEHEVYAEGPDAGLPTDPKAWPTPRDVEHDINSFREEYQGAPCRVHLRNRKGGDINEWPADLRVREFPEVRR